MVRSSWISLKKALKSPPEPTLLAEMFPRQGLDANHQGLEEKGVLMHALQDGTECTVLEDLLD